MATVPGLRPFLEDTVGRALAIPGRVVPREFDPQPPALRPQAAPVETYFRPAPAPKDDNLTRLADALGGFNAALGKFGDTMVKSAHDDIPGEFARTVGNKRGQDAMDAVAANPKLQGRMEQRYAQGQLGLGVADATAEEITRDYTSGKFDKDNGDIEAFLGSYVDRDLKLYDKTDPNFSSNYRDRIMARVAAIRGEQARFTAERGSEARQQAAQDTFTATVREAIDKGSDPAAIPGQLAGVMHANRAFAAIPFAKQQEFLVESAKTLAADMDRTPERRAPIMAAITAILDGEQTAADGSKHRLTENAGGTGALAREVLGKAKDTFAKQNKVTLISQTAEWENKARYAPAEFDRGAFDAWNKANPGTLSPDAQVAVIKSHEAAMIAKRETDADLQAERGATAAADTLTRQDYERATQGQLWNVGDERLPTKKMILSGGQLPDYKTVTADDRKANVLRFFDEDSARQETFLLNRAKTPAEIEAVKQQTFGRKLEFYSTNDIAPDEWKTLLRGGIRQATDAALSGKAPPEQLAQAFDTYQRVKKSAPNLLPQVADDGTRAFYDMAEVAKAYGYGDPMQQLNVAARYFAKRDAEAENVKLADVTAAVNDLKPGAITRTIKRVFGVDSLENPGVMTDKVAKFATMLNVGLNVPVAEAIPLAIERIKPTLAVVNGYAIDTNDKRLGPNFERNAEQYLRNVAHDFGPQIGVKDPKELTLVPHVGEPDVFQVVVKNRGHLPPGLYAEGGNGTPRDIRFVTPDLIAAVSDLNRTKAAIKAERAADDRYKPMALIPGTDIGISRPKLSGYSPEELAKLDEGTRQALKARDAAQAARTEAADAQVRQDNAEIAAGEAEVARTPAEPLTKRLRKGAREALGMDDTGRPKKTKRTDK